MRKRMRVYLAGPYSDKDVLGVLRNIGRGEYYAYQLFKQGFGVFVPWFDRSFVISGWMDEFEVKDFYEYSMEWLMVSEAVFVVPDHKGLKRIANSVGIRKELDTADELGIPVFFDMDRLIDYARSKGFSI